MSTSSSRAGGGLLILRAVIVGLLVGMIAANVWPVLLLKLGMPGAAGAELLFLAAYVFVVRGGGPIGSKAPRAEAARVGRLSGAQWGWGLVAAAAFAATIHAAIAVLYRLVPFPAEAFHRGYDISFVPAGALRWLTVVVSAASAGICEETGFRGYMQRPIERRFGPVVAILISATSFMLLHLTKSWSTAGMVPIVLLAGVLLGTLAWASNSLVFCMIAHTVMDVGLFAYWWTQIAGTFAQRPIFETGIDRAFQIEAGALVIALLVTLGAIFRLRRLRAG